jgi:formyltetrahydrofolate deformylase
MHNSAILLVSCPDRKGVVASIADFIFRHNGNILFADEHGDEASNLFLTRVEFDPTDFDFDLAEFAERFAPIARDFEMHWRLAHSSDRPRIAIFVSKYDHCLQDLLYRHQSGELRCDIPLIISNHPDNQRIADFYRVPYFVVPVTKENKRDAEQKQIALVREHKCGLVVLARYMQVLSSEFIESPGVGQPDQYSPLFFAGVCGLKALPPSL